MDSAVVVCGLGFGDEGKGLMTDFFVRSTAASLVVRFNGGCQAAHNVITPDGIHHTFSQVGSGALAGAATFLSRYMLVEPFALAEELRCLGEKVDDPARAVTIDPRCVVVTPFHRLANRLREIGRGSKRHGSVGLGIGEARGDELSGLSLRIGELALGPTTLERIQAAKLAALSEMRTEALYQEIESVDCADLLEAYCEVLAGIRVAPWESVAPLHRRAVMEGAQGVLLDETFGFSPYNSWTDCTFRNAESLLDEAGCRRRMKVGVLRSYHTRHGTGPFITEDETLRAPESHNGLHPWMGPFRFGNLDLVAARYAVQVARPDCLAVTHMDQRPSDAACVSYGVPLPAVITAEDLRGAMPKYVAAADADSAIQRATGTIVRFRSWGPRATDVEVGTQAEPFYLALSRASCSI